MTQPIDAHLRLHTAVDQLLLPTTQRLDRSRAIVDPDVAATADAHIASYQERRDELEAQYRDNRDRLRERHSKYLAARDRAGMRRAMDAITHLDEQRADVEEARHRADAEIPSLLDQLEEAVHSSSSTGGAAGAGAHRSPIGLDAAWLLRDIQHGVAYVEGALADRVREWAAQDLADVDAAAAAAEQWVSQARAVLVPPRSFEVKIACPACGARHVWQLDDLGQRVRRPAIVVSYATRSARCASPSCGETWGFEKLPLLAAVLEQDAAGWTA